jgi:hypothetical protein
MPGTSPGTTALLFSDRKDRANEQRHAGVDRNLRQISHVEISKA